MKLYYIGVAFGALVFAAVVVALYNMWNRLVFLLFGLVGPLT